MVRTALRNPHAVVVLALIVAILGSVSVARTPVDVFPDLHAPAVLVAISYRGMPAADMEFLITRHLERMFMLANGVDHLESRSLVGVAHQVVGIDGADAGEAVQARLRPSGAGPGASGEGEGGRGGEGVGEGEGARAGHEGTLCNPRATRDYPRIG